MNVFLIESWIFIVLAAALLAVEVWALVNALRFSPAAYVAASKRTKGFWGALTGVSVLLGLLGFFGYGGLIFQLAGIIIAGIFLADVFPALKAVMARRQGNSR